MASSERDITKRPFKIYRRKTHLRLSWHRLKGMENTPEDLNGWSPGKVNEKGRVLVRISLLYAFYMRNTAEEQRDRNFQFIAELRSIGRSLIGYVTSKKSISMIT